MLYKIVKTTDLDGNYKESAAHRIGRVMDISHIPVGDRFFAECVYPGIEKSMITSPIVSYQKNDNKLIITTKNTIYWFERVD